MTTFWSLVLIGIVSMAWYIFGYNTGSRQYKSELENKRTLLNAENEMLRAELKKVKEREAE